LCVVSYGLDLCCWLLNCFNDFFGGFVILFLWFLISGLVIMSFSDLSFVFWMVGYLTWLIYVFISISLVI
ncbi:hypothetical protein, partial [Campylobacter sp. W0066.1]|uniref:hypothetical protein n=1 Tax=Campylobacter sp. W0066.1 TaxID=2735751 RepID=UPI00301D4A6D|nr:hypothetical protein [Campylobacter sp. W0066.1]